METRKVQRVSNGTFTVSLPKQWAEAEGVEAGTVVTLRTHIDGLLVVQAPGREYRSTDDVTVEIPDESVGRVERALRAAYGAGCETVTLVAPESFTAAQRGTFRRVARNLAGATVDEESEDRIVVRNLLDASDVSVRQSVRHLQFVALSMHREATAALTGDGSADHLSDRDDEADRLYAMVDRHFVRGLARLDEIDALGVTRSELFRLHTAARELERVADHAERIASVAASVDDVSDPVARDVTEAAEVARDAVANAVNGVVSDADVATASAALCARDRVRESTEEIDRRLFETSGADYRFTHAVDGVRRTAEHAGTIAEVALRAAISDGEAASDDGRSDDGRFPDLPS